MARYILVGSGLTRTQILIKKQGVVVGVIYRKNVFLVDFTVYYLKVTAQKDTVAFDTAMDTRLLVGVVYREILIPMTI